MGNQFLSLSLFIVLLTFFIVLNSISTFEVAKTRPVLKSLGQAFRTDAANPLHGLSQISALPGENVYTKDMTGRGGALQRIEGLFSSQVQGIDIRQNRLGTEMAIRLPFDEFSRQINAELTPENDPGMETQKRFLPMLVSILDAGSAALEGNGQTALRMDMVLETAQKPQDAVPSGNARIESLAALAGRLETAGMPTNLIGIGVASGQDGMITLHFRRHEPFDPAMADAAARKEVAP